MQRFPARTVLLMVVALLAFAWSFRQTHRPARATPPRLDGLRVDLSQAPADAGARGPPGAP
jgi:hypothetical protein